MNVSYKEMVKNFTDQDYEPTHKFYTIEQCCGSVGLSIRTGTISDPVRAMKSTKNGKIYFTTKKLDIVPFHRAEQNDDGTFQLFELTYEAYCAAGF